jgi:hypothetical protein
MQVIVRVTVPNTVPFETNTPTNHALVQLHVANVRRQCSADEHCEICFAPAG